MKTIVGDCFTALRVGKNLKDRQYHALGRMYKHQNFHTLLMGAQDGTTLESGLADSYKAKHILNLWPSSSTLRNLPKIHKNIFPRKDLYKMFIYLYL